MKHFTLSLTLAFLVASGYSSAQSKSFRTPMKSKTEKSGDASRYIIKAASEPGTWKPKKEVFYEPDMEGETDAWLEYGQFTNEYDSNGNNISTTEDYGDNQNRTLSKYDAYNNRIEVVKQSMEAGTWVNTEKTEYVYDPVVKNFQTERKAYSWNAATGQWDMNYAHKKVITRNAKGFVTRLSVTLMNENNQYDELERTEITYTNDDLPATSWKFLQADDKFELVEKVKYDKINWDRSDGQILNSDEAFMVGNNRIKKADIYDEGVKTATFECTYVDGKTDFDSRIKSVSSEEEIHHTLTELDGNGSYKEEIIEKFDENGDGQLVTYDQYVVCTYDDRKNPVSEEYFEVVDGTPEQTDGMKMIYTYGPNGEITETVNQMYDYDAAEYMNMEKVIASDFVFFASGIDCIPTKLGTLSIVVSDDRLIFENEGMSRYSIYSATGTLLSTGQVENNRGEVSLAGLPAGLYFIKVSDNQYSETAKFIKK